MVASGQLKVAMPEIFAGLLIGFDMTLIGTLWRDVTRSAGWASCK
ncbi:hypothetical protein [Alsobacter soli]|nr:hypothetical protein [Alsobacter soli]